MVKLTSAEEKFWKEKVKVTLREKITFTSKCPSDDTDVKHRNIRTFEIISFHENVSLFAIMLTYQDTYICVFSISLEILYVFHVFSSELYVLSCRKSIKRTENFEFTYELLTYKYIKYFNISVHRRLHIDRWIALCFSGNSMTHNFPGLANTDITRDATNTTVKPTTTER